MRYCATLLVLIAVASIFNESSVGADDWNYGKIAGEITQAVKAGKLTKEEAAAKLAALKKAAVKKGIEGKKTTDYAAIEAAVKAGKLTKDEAAAKLAALKKAAVTKGKKNFGLKGKKRTDYDAVVTRLFELVKAGQLSEEQAKAMWDVARKVGDAKKAD